MKAALIASLAGLTVASAAMGQLSISAVSNIPGTFVDISSTGTSIGTITDDFQGIFTTTVGNQIFPAGQVVASNNGWAATGFTSAITSGSYANQSISGTTFPVATGSMRTGGTNYMMPYWDDFLPSTNTATPSSVRWQQIDNVLIIQWTNEDLFNAGGNGVGTMQMQIYGTPFVSGGSIVYAQFVYRDTNFGTASPANDGGQASIGYLSSSPANANTVQFSFNTQSVTGTTDSPTPGLPSVVSLVTAVPTPGAAALLGLGGLMVGRRRR